MTTYSAFRLNAEVALSALAKLTVSGTVTVNGSPVERTIVSYVYPKMNEPYFTHSNKTDGAFSINIACGKDTRLIVMALGEDGEETKVFDWVTRS